MDFHYSNIKADRLIEVHNFCQSTSMKDFIRNGGVGPVM